MALRKILIHTLYPRHQSRRTGAWAPQPGHSARTAISLAVLLWLGLATPTGAEPDRLHRPQRAFLTDPDRLHRPQRVSLTDTGVSFRPPLRDSANYLPQVTPVEDTFLLLSLTERTLYLYHQNTLLQAYPVAVGRSGWETPTGRFTIFQMLPHPTWEHPFTGELVPPGDNNPLGHRWLGFWSDGTNAIGFHGTPDEASIGRAASHGCVRLTNQDVVALYDQVTIGTPVYVVP